MKDLKKIKYLILDMDGCVYHPKYLKTLFSQVSNKMTEFIALKLSIDKAKAKQTMKAAGVPVVPGGDGILEGPDEALEKANEMGYPIMLKASAGGGGRGMRFVTEAADVIASYKSANQESITAFGNGDIYIEKFIQNPRHIEVQILGDKHGNAIHYGERECSIQRRHQKLIEESPSPLVDEETRKKIGNAAVSLSLIHI